MRQTRRGAYLAAVLTLTAVAVCFTLPAGCDNTGAPGAPGLAQAASQPRPGPEAAKGAAQLWAENCTRCHNSRDAGSYSDSQWEVAMHHMRIRANLTAEEHKRILEFLKASN
jgi:hypothetical protein